MYWFHALIILARLLEVSNGLLVRGPNQSLRILPLGDSITFGTDSSDGNGYRLDLENLIEPANALQYIGSVRAGSMADNYNEGHPGFRIDQIANAASQDFVSSSPNVVLLMAGTNDVLQNYSLSRAPGRLGALITQLTTSLPKAAILVATLTPLLNAAEQVEVKVYNSAMYGIVNASTQAGKLVMMVDMSNVTDSGIDNADGIHPNDAGYQVMANAWYAGILEAAGKGWIGPAPNVSYTNFAASSVTPAAGPIATTTATKKALAATARPLGPLSMLILMGISGIFCT